MADTTVTEESVPPNPQDLDPNLVRIIIRPQADDWIMGEDWETYIHHSTTMFGIKIHIENYRGIPRHRQQLRIKGKSIVPNREAWSIRRMGVIDGSVITVEPTFFGSWYWNDYDYYAEIVLKQVEEEIEKADKGRIRIDHLPEKISLPPPIKTSLRVFLRKYPERINMYMDTGFDYLWIRKPSYAKQLPVYSSTPIELGDPYVHPLPNFDWDAYKDVDDMDKVEIIEEVKKKSKMFGGSFLNRSNRPTSASSAVGQGLISEPSDNQLDDATPLDENENAIPLDETEVVDEVQQKLRDSMQSVDTEEDTKQ